jgi:hypothetical protein
VRILHVALGWAVVAAFGLLWLWGLGAAAIRRDPGRWFWGLVAVVQVTLALEVAAGLVLLALGRRQDLLHYVYGSVFPILMLGVAHVLARREDRPAWVYFAWAAFFAFGLTLRALMTGLEIG